MHNMFSMPMDREMQLDNEMMRVWHMIQELGEQLSHNQKIVASLKGQAGSLKNQALQNSSGYALRRFNVDLSKEVFESELEKSSAQVIIENQTLQQENRQLTVLLKEYEQTLDTVMAKFRNHAYAAQQHELTLTKHYEALHYSRDAAAMNADFSSSMQVSAILERLSLSMRLLIRSLNGEDPEGDGGEGEIADIETLLEGGDGEDWAAAREVEIERLERENAELRKALGIDPETAHERGIRDEDLVDLKLTMPTRHASTDSPSHLWALRSPPQQPLGITGGQQQQQTGQSQQNVGYNQQPTEPQPNPRTVDIPFQPGMRTAGGTMRRSSMFGQRVRGNGSPLWSQARSNMWPQLNGNNGIDL